MVKKKNYNPFKMWGSYAGAYFLLPVYNLFAKTSAWDEPFLDVLTNNLFWIFTELNSSIETVFALMLFAWLLVGFLIGWGIHSLARRFKIF